jgi:hypothetical protein
MFTNETKKAHLLTELRTILVLVVLAWAVRTAGRAAGARTRARPLAPAAITAARAPLAPVCPA